MTFGDLKGMVGQTIDYYEVKGNSVKAKGVKYLEVTIMTIH